MKFMVEHCTEIRVSYADTDKMGVVYYGNYATYYEIGRGEWIRQWGISYADLEASGIIMPVIELQSRFLRPAHYDDLLQVYTRLEEWPEGPEICFHTTIIGPNGKKINQGQTRLVFFDSRQGRKVAMPALLKDKLYPQFHG